ncbi:MAG: potassium channel protein [Sedimentisphaerales bacterium]|nr:potassium channel protein [Sedimentisphaerales bacterium]
MRKRNQRIRLTPLDRLIFALVLILVVVSVGTAGFVIIEGWSFLDAFYMTLATISTLGMKATHIPEINRGGEIWIMVLIVVGILIAMIALSTIAGMVVEGQMRSILGRRKVSLKIASLQNHIIVAGYGRMGRSVCHHLLQGSAELVIIDQDNAHTAQAEQDGFLYVLGDASDEAVLKAAGIERARGLVSVLATDAENVFVTLIARDLSDTLFIAARAETIKSEERLLRAGANKAICPQVIGARRLANILTRPGVVDFVDFATEGINLEAQQFHLDAECKLIGQSLRQANLPRELGILVVAMKHQDGQTVFNPNPDTVLQQDDTMIVIGQLGSMAKLEERYS